MANPEKDMVEAYGALRPSRSSPIVGPSILAPMATILKIDKETDPETAGEDMARTMGELGFPQI